MYMLTAIMTPFVIPKWVEIRVTLIFISLLMGFSLLLVSPVYEESNLVVMCLGLFLTGAFLGPIMIPNLQEMIFVVKAKYPENDLEHANSLLGGILNCNLGLG